VRQKDNGDRKAGGKRGQEGPEDGMHMRGMRDRGQREMRKNKTRVTDGHDGKLARGTRGLEEKIVQ
jgi:hypothetical protein